MRHPALFALAASFIVPFAAYGQRATAGAKAILSLHNAITGRTVPGTSPLPATLQRVELPPSYTLAVSGPKEAASAVFSINDKVVHTDNQPPFFLSEDAGQKPIAWEGATGEFMLSVKLYAQPNGTGASIAQVHHKLTIGSTGMDLSGAGVSEADQDAWLEKNLDAVLQKKTFNASNGLAMAYRLYLPPSYSPTVKYPLVIYLHGRGQRGTDNGPRVYAGGLFRGRRSLVSPTMQQTFPSIVIVPQCSDKTTNEEWAKWVGNTPETPFQGLGRDGSYALAPEPSDSGKAVLELIEATIKELSVDPKRVYFTGISMGGFGTWEYAARRPELFAAAVPMAGYSDPAQVARFAKIPFWIFHGGADETNPVQGSRTMHTLLKNAGADVRYTEYPETRHGDSFRKAWTETELLPWIFSQRRE